MLDIIELNDTSSYTFKRFVSRGELLKTVGQGGERVELGIEGLVIHRS